MQKIGIFGGTFDPIHNVHLEIAVAAKKFLHLDRIILVPTGNPPHKDKSKVTSFSDRFNMVRLAIEDLEGFYVSNIENKSSLKKSYTSDGLINNPKYNQFVLFNIYIRNHTGNYIIRPFKMAHMMQLLAYTFQYSKDECGNRIIQGFELSADDECLTDLYKKIVYGLM